MKEHMALDKLVNKLLLLPKVSGKFADAVNSRDLISVSGDDTFEVGTPFKAPYFTKKFTESMLSLEPKIPNYTISKNLENLAGYAKARKLKDVYNELYGYHDKVVDSLTFFEELYAPSKPLSRSEYVRLFNNAFKTYLRAFGKYNELVSQGVIKTEDDFKLEAKVNLEEFVQGVAEYQQSLHSISTKMNDLKDEREKSYNPKKLNKEYVNINNFVNEILNLYSSLQETGYAQKLNEGIDLIELENRKLVKPFANLMYSIVMPYQEE